MSYTPGGSGLPAPVVRKFPFAFNTPNLLTGVEIYTPTVGDILLDAWLQIDTSWDGTSPMFDFGSFVGGNPGFYGGGNVPMNVGSGQDSDPGTGFKIGHANNDLLIQDVPGLANQRIVPGIFTTADPLKVVVSQNGTPTGDDPGGTQGAAILYIVTVTPV